MKDGRKEIHGPGSVHGIRIGHLIETNGPGGAEQVVSLLARRLQEEGAWNVVFVPEGGEGWLERQLEGSGVVVEHFRFPDRTVSPGFAAWLSGRLADLGVQIAHSHEFAMAFYGACACRARRVPHVITMHGGTYYAERERRLIALRAASALSHCTVAVSEPLHARLLQDLKLPPSRVRMITNGVPQPTGTDAPLRAELGLGVHDDLIVAVGNLYPVKGHVHLIEAVSILGDDRPDVHVAIAGRGHLREPLRHLAQRLGVADRVHLLGLRADVHAVLRSADVFALPSLSEGLPMALLEAMFASLPIVATRVGQVPEVLDDGDCGLLVPPGDPEALASALHALLADPVTGHVLGARAHRRAHESFSLDRMVARYAALYAEALRRPGKPDFPVLRRLTGARVPS